MSSQGIRICSTGQPAKAAVPFRSIKNVNPSGGNTLREAWVGLGRGDHLRLLRAAKAVRRRLGGWEYWPNRGTKVRCSLAFQSAPKGPAVLSGIAANRSSRFSVKDCAADPVSSQELRCRPVSVRPLEAALPDPVSSAPVRAALRTQFR
ncbi:hypothetical protein CYMTET_20311, partial [Cymbomonas tetramitiformis]